jgi:phage N-6-adenine-methyltransferase
MTAYTSAIEVMKSEQQHYLRDIGDQWRTPDLLWWGINDYFGPFTLDLFTDGQNSKCAAFYTAEDNALTQDWSSRLSELGGAAYANPPYSRAQQHDGQNITGMTHIIDHTMAMRERGGRYVYLIKAATSESWWPEGADHIAFIRGRVGFDVPEWFIPADEKQKPSGASFSGAIVVFDKSWSGPQMSYVRREDLEAKGSIYMAQIARAVKKLAGAAA